MPNTVDEPKSLDDYVASFERSRGSDLAAFLPLRAQRNYLEVLTELIRVDLEFAWDRGDPRQVEHYLQRFPELRDDDSALEAITAEERRLRRGAGVDSSTQQTVALDGSPEDPNSLPQIGDVVSGFALVDVLGTGAFGRVYLARQADLADRLVALKVSSKLPGEPRTLARLQHANIVPIYSVHRFGHFHVACMPWLGRTTFADLIVPQSRASTVVTTPTVTGNVGTLESATQAARLSPTLPPGKRVDVVLRLALGLANALVHAHARGILHRDIKPANVLLTDDGVPMLLDFNLASDTTTPPTHIGGTPRYMAPEQQAHLRDNRVVPDVRADLYSLGVTLYELLTGRLPDAAVDLRTHCPDASPATAAIFARLLARDPDLRYASAADLAEDLERQVHSRPLKFASDRSPRERMQKWAHRHPRWSSAVSLGTIAALLLVSLLAVLANRSRSLERAEAGQSLAVLMENQQLVRGLLADRSGPTVQIEQALTLSSEAVAPFADGSTLTRLTPSEQILAQSALRNMAYYRARGRAILATRQPLKRESHLEVAWTEHQALWQSEANPSAGLRAQRAQLLTLRGETSAAESQAKLLLNAPPDPTGTFQDDSRASLWEAIRYLKQGYVIEAGRPAYWLTLGRLLASVGEYDEARVHLRVAAELDPHSPWPPFHSGVVELSQRRYSDAIREFTRVLVLSPGLQEAIVNRALARMAMKEYAVALADLQQVSDPSCRVHFLREMALTEMGRGTEARTERDAGLKLDPADAEDWCARGEAKLRLVPPDTHGALADFQAAAVANPRLREAWMNQAHTLGEHLGKHAAAIEVLNTVVSEFPKHHLARSSRGVYHARLNHRTEAIDDADAAMTDGAPALVCYQAASIYALVGRTSLEKERAIALLRSTLKADPSWVSAMTDDADLKALHSLPAFRSLLNAGREMNR